MNEIEIMKRIQIVLAKCGARLFRNNNALAWAGHVHRYPEPTTVTVNPCDVVIRNARPIHAGLGPDTADLVGFSTQNGKFISCEVKVPGKQPTPAQFNWLNAVHAAHGIAFWADSEESAIKQYRQLIQ